MAPRKGLYLYITTTIYFVVINFSMSVILPLDLPLFQNFLHRAHIFLFDLLTRDFGIPLAGGDLAMPQEVTNGDDLGPVCHFQNYRSRFENYLSFLTCVRKPDKAQKFLYLDFILSFWPKIWRPGATIPLSLRI